MINVFVTIGTTSFDKLMYDVDMRIAPSHSVRFQIADGKYHPRNGLYKQYFENIDEEIYAADIIICHAGAGSVFPLLESNKRLLVVPNLFRRDTHQIELADYLERNNFSEVAWDTEKITKHFHSVTHTAYAKYEKDDFNMASKLTEMIMSSCAAEKSNSAIY